MRIHLDGVQLLSTSGPNTFAGRLYRKLALLGHDVVTNSGAGADASIVFIEPSGAPLARKVIQRLDGIWFRPQDYVAKNVKIKACYETAHGHVFQSRFDSNMVTGKWGRQDAIDRIVPNSIDTGLVEITDHALIHLRKKYSSIFVCAASWHPQKRLRANIEVYEHLKRFHENSCLIVMGPNASANIDYNTSPDILFTGTVDQQLCLQVYRLADWMIHTAWLDHAPNTVVECLSQQTPVLCTDSGGTAELVRNFGLVLKESFPYNFELVDYDDPPPIDVTQIKEALPHKETFSHIRSLPSTMDQVAAAYISLAQEIV